VSDRWVRKLLARMKTDGDAVVVHGRRGRSSNRRIEEQTQARVVELLKQPEWYDFGPTFASEQLSSGTTSASARRRCADGWWRQGYGRRSRASSARRISGDRGGADTASWCSGTRPLTTGWRGDRAGIFMVAPRAKESAQQRQEADRLTQFGRALREVGIGWIPAYSPQAKAYASHCTSWVRAATTCVAGNRLEYRTP